MATTETETELVGMAAAATPSKAQLDDVEAQLDPEEDEEARKKKEVERTLWTRIWQGSAIATVVLSLVALVLSWGASTFVAALVAIPVAGAVFYYQMELQDMDTLRKVQNDLRHMVNDFMEQNEVLTNSNTRLEGELVPLKEIEEKLETIAKENGANVNQLRGLVKENQKFLDGMNEHLREGILQDMMEAVMLAEKDEDGHFSDREIRILAVRLKGLPAIDVDEEKFTERIQVTRSLSAVLDLMRTIRDVDTPEDERIFTIFETQ